MTRRSIASLLLLLGTALWAAVAAQGGPYTLVLRGGWIADGSGNPMYRGDVAITGDTLAAIAPSIDARGAAVIDVSGQVVAPGFIDIHTHARRGIFDVPTADNYVRQGVTTVMEGPDGGSPVPLKPFLDKVGALPPAVNFGAFIGQGSVRREVIGEADRQATTTELDRMKDLVRQGMYDGAFGLSSGLIYVPGNFTSHAEVVELGKVAGALGGMYISHMRDEAAHVVDSVRDTIDVGEQGHMPAQVTHHKVVGTSNWGASTKTLALVDAARARGVDATIDQYPYTASSSGLTILLPAWSLDGGQTATVKRLADPVTRGKVRAAVVENIKYDRGGGDPKNVVIASCAWDPSLAGKSLADITRARGLEVTIENAAETLLTLVEKGSAQAVYHAMSEEDLERILKHPATMVASDGEIPIFGKAAPHPRSYGTFVRVLGRYVRERKVLTVEEAVRKMSSFPAQRLGLADRGLLRPGLKADVTVFDPTQVRDTATFERPHQYAEGVAVVIVNGEIVYRDGKMTGARPGRILFGPAAKKGGVVSRQ
jgi:N-acyl-D-amino-acid deacylase